MSICGRFPWGVSKREDECAGSAHFGKRRLGSPRARATRNMAQSLKHKKVSLPEQADAEAPRSKDGASSAGCCPLEPEDLVSPDLWAAGERPARSRCGSRKSEGPDPRIDSRRLSFGSRASFRANTHPELRPPTRRERLLSAVADNATAMRARPVIPLAALLAMAAVLGTMLALFSVIDSSDRARQMDYTRAIALHAKAAAETQSKTWVHPAAAIGSIIQLDPSVPASLAHFAEAAPQVLSSLGIDGDASTTTLQFAPDTVIAAVYPQTAATVGAIGLDMFSLRGKGTHAAITVAIQSGQYYFRGPHMVSGGDAGEVELAVRYPVFVNVTSATILSSDGSQGSTTGAHFWDVSPATDSAPATVFWGFVNVLLDWDVLLASMGLDTGVTSVGWRLVNPAHKAGAPDTVLAQSSTPATGVVQRVSINLQRDAWVLEVGLTTSPVPRWMPAAWTAAALVTLAVGALTVVTLLSHRHVALLEALLPRRVIAALYRRDFVAEALPDVAVLFVDVVE